MTWIRNDVDFQTPERVCDFMVSLAPARTTYLEPSPGAGNIVNAIKRRYPYSAVVVPPSDFLNMSPIKCDDLAVIMNPPFTPMEYGYRHLVHAMEFSRDIIALLPMFILINSDKRVDHLWRSGLRRVILLPRSVFRGTRIQTGIFVFAGGPPSAVELDYYKRYEPKKSTSGPTKE